MAIEKTVAVEVVGTGSITDRRDSNNGRGKQWAGASTMVVAAGVAAIVWEIAVTMGETTTVWVNQQLWWQHVQ